MEIKLNGEYLGYYIASGMNPIQFTITGETEKHYEVTNEWGSTWTPKNQVVLNSPGLQIFRELKSITFGDNPPSTTTTKYPEMHVITEQLSPKVGAEVIIGTEGEEPTEEKAG